MKIKSLLFAALVAGMSMTASAQSEGTAYTDCGDVLNAEAVTIKPGEIGVLNVVLTRQTAPDFTNIQFDIVFPDGIRPVLDEDEVYDWSGEDITMVGKPKVPAVAYRNNFQREDFYPEHTVVGVNMTKTAQTKNPCQLYCFNVAADPTVPSGDYQLIAKNMKYTCYSNDSYATAAEQVLATVTVDNPIVGITDLNATVNNGVRKYIENGQVVIEKAGVKYNVAGQAIK